MAKEMNDFLFSHSVFAYIFLLYEIHFCLFFLFARFSFRPWIHNPHSSHFILYFYIGYVYSALKEANRGIWKGVHRSFGIFTLFLHLQTNQAHQFAYSWLLLPINTHQNGEKTNNIRKRYVRSLIWVQKIIRIRSSNEPGFVRSPRLFFLSWFRFLFHFIFFPLPRRRCFACSQFIMEK